MQMRACAVRRSRDLRSLRCGTTLWKRLFAPHLSNSTVQIKQQAASQGLDGDNTLVAMPRVMRNVANLQGRRTTRINLSASHTRSHPTATSGECKSRGRMFRRTRLVRQPAAFDSHGKHCQRPHCAPLVAVNESKNVWPRAHATRPHDGCGLGRKRGCGCLGVHAMPKAVFSFSLFHTLSQRADTQLNTASSALGAGDVAAAHTRTLDMNKRDTRHHEHVDDLCMHMFPKTEVTGHLLGHHHTNSFTSSQPCETCSPSCLLAVGGRQKHTGCQRG
jgi:hypothetical protein